jgi:hypothetical protein
MKKMMNSLSRQVLGLFSYLAGFLALSVIALAVAANGTGTAALVLIPDQAVNVDGDEQEEHFSASLRVLQDGSVAGSATIEDEAGTNVYRFSKGVVVCDVAYQSYLLLDSEAESVENQQLFGGSRSFKTALILNEHSNTLNWANHWQTAANGYELRGQMIFLAESCSHAWLDWFTTM